MPSVPVYKLALVRANTHTPVVWAAGGPVEVDLVQAVVDAAAKESMGFFVTQADALAAVRRAVEAALYAFKLEASAGSHER